VKEQFIQIIDFLIPTLDVYEQVFYLYMYRHTVLEEKREITIPLSTIHEKVSFGIGRMGAPISRQAVRNKFKSLEKKGCIRKIKTTKKGIIYEIFLPEEINDIIPKKVEEIEIRLDDLDFYKIEKYRLSILKRENDQCFYCLSNINTDNFFIDHVIPQVENGNNSYKNCVASCINCNSNKQGIKASEFARSLFRKNLLIEHEFKSLLKKINQLKKG